MFLLALCVVVAVVTPANVAVELGRLLKSTKVACLLTIVVPVHVIACVDAAAENVETGAEEAASCICTKERNGRIVICSAVVPSAEAAENCDQFVVALEMCHSTSPASAL